MNYFYGLVCLMIHSFVFAQTYDNYNISLLSHLNPNTDTANFSIDNRAYSGCWGWYQSSTNREYAISGASHGTYFIDITVPGSPSICAFVPGRSNCTWREIKTYQNYCYIISDDASPNKFQIVDMSTLPATVSLVHNDTTIFERGHTIWIDQDKMYIGGISFANGAYQKSMAIYSLATPTAPSLLRFLPDDVPTINYVHDMYVRNDTIYASTGFQGLYVLKYDNNSNTFSQLGSYTGYATQGYNHSSFLTQNGKNLVFCDEIPDGMPIRLVDVQNLSNIQPINTFIPATGTTPHNPYVLGNNFAVVSCYQDGLVIYDISNPNSVSLAGYFDTYPQGGFAQNSYAGTYRGNWGAYPYLPSGHIVANDMQNGIFILDAAAALGSAANNPVQINEKNDANDAFFVFPNPVIERICLNTNSNEILNFRLSSTTGEIAKQGQLENPDKYIDCSQLTPGLYFLNITSESFSSSQKIIITK